MASTLRAHGPPPVIRALVVCGPHMCGPYGASPSVLTRHHANTERLRPNYVAGARMIAKVFQTFGGTPTPHSWRTFTLARTFATQPGTPEWKRNSESADSISSRSSGSH